MTILSLNVLQSSFAVYIIELNLYLPWRTFISLDFHERKTHTEDSVPSPLLACGQARAQNFQSDEKIKPLIKTKYILNIKENMTEGFLKSIL